MKSLSTIGLALSVIFGCLLLALLAELYYLLWWKKRITRRGIEDGPAKEFFFYFFCGKKPSSSSSSSSSSPPTTMKPQEICSRNTLVHEPQPQNQRHGDPTMEDSWLKNYGEETMEAELMRLSGPPRFLFTIKEETKEDLESEDEKSKSTKGSRTRSLSDVLLAMESTPPFLTPIASPPYFTPPLSPFFESNTCFDFNNKRPCSSPPPAFKFLRDAEEKLYRSRVLEEAQRLVKKKDASIQVDVDDDGHENGSASKFKFPVSPSSSVTEKSSFPARDEENGSFITLIFPRNEQHHLLQQQHGNNVSVSQYPSSSSQVLPLASSPPKTLHSPSNLRSIHIRSFTR